MENPAKVQVAVVRGANRRGAVAEALSLIADDLAGKVTPNSVLIPDLSSGRKPGDSTQPGAISATIDAVLAAGAETITIAAASPRPEIRADHWFEQLGYRQEVWGRPVSFLDLAEEPIEEIASRNLPHENSSRIRIPRVLLNDDCRISLATSPKFRNAGLANLLNILPPQERDRLKGPASARGGSIFARFRLLLGRPDGGNPEVLGEDLASLLSLVRPAISIIDGFPASKRSGPTRGRWAPPGTVIAGTDPVAVDAVAASLWGYRRTPFDLLSLAESIGLGTSDLGRIEIVGDRPLLRSRASDHGLRMHWRSRRQWAVRSRVRSR